MRGNYFGGQIKRAAPKNGSGPFKNKCVLETEVYSGARDLHFYINRVSKNVGWKSNGGCESRKVRACNTGPAEAAIEVLTLDGPMVRNCNFHAAASCPTRTLLVETCAFMGSRKSISEQRAVLHVGHSQAGG